ncbi:MAG: TetR family transcriptional regulator [Candidatus Sericytochromatia bacterium]|nr:TetR family transcriptional regulator [Candidatus Tanganyikabacteria bacterium]
MARPRTCDAERIREAAAALLAAAGPAGLTVAAVAKAAGVSPGTVYNYFRNKAHLLACAGDLPGARTAWIPPAPEEAPAAWLERLASAALGRFRLLGDAAALGAECAELTDLLAGHLGEERARACYLALAGAVLLGEPAARDPQLARAIARLLTG